jgi:hypothetical protein
MAKPIDTSLPAEIAPASAHPDAVKATILGYERDETENNARLSFTAQTADGQNVEGYTSYVTQHGNDTYRAAGLGIDTDNDGLTDTWVDTHNGIGVTMVVTINPETGKREVVDYVRPGEDINNDRGSMQHAQATYTLVDGVLQDERIRPDELRSMIDFTKDSATNVGIKPREQSPIYASGDAVIDERTGQLMEGRSTIRADLDGDGRKETTVTSRLNGNQYTLEVETGQEKRVVGDPLLAKEMIATVATAREDAVYTDPEKAKMMALAQLAVKEAGLDKLAPIQIAQADAGEKTPLTFSAIAADRGNHVGGPG